jgi:hypothetical protein
MQRATCTNTTFMPLPVLPSIRQDPLRTNAERNGRSRRRADRHGTHSRARTHHARASYALAEHGIVFPVPVSLCVLAACCPSGVPGLPLFPNLT